MPAIAPQRPHPTLESVGSCPRPPRLEPCSRHLVVVHQGVIVAETRRGLRVIETSHPPVYYFPPGDVRADLLRPAGRTTGCEWKGAARTFDVVVGRTRALRAAWTYPDPTAAFAPLAGCVSFCAGRLDRCTVDGEHVRPQEGGFYGGWIVADLEGPFKGAPGTEGG